MPGWIVVGAQWGDEGKGKIVDLLSEKAHWVVRYQGGNNAGHTIIFDGQKYVLHLLPSGVFHPKKKIVLSPGVVIDPEAFFAEMEQLPPEVPSLEGRLFVSPSCHTILSYHKVLDAHREEHGKKIGTTRKGIGPTYEDHRGRRGFRLCDFSAEVKEAALQDLEVVLEEKRKILGADTQEVFSAEDIFSHYHGWHKRLRPYFSDTAFLLHKALEAGDTVLFEGAQGSMLDVEHGTYPFVTSSNTLAGGACTGSGIGPMHIQKVIGITKAYCTRVGEGPFPTEIMSSVAEDLRLKGKEFGATTGRPRRCGWLDIPALRKAVQLNGCSALALTKLDVLDSFPTLPVGVGYRDEKGRFFEEFPQSLGRGQKVEPVYKEFPGWNTSTAGVTKEEDLPKAARDYVDAISELVGVPFEIISTGPSREDTIVRQAFL